MGTTKAISHCRVAMLLSIPLLAGCATQIYDLDQWRAATDHRFPNTTLHSFEHALQAVFAASRPGEYQLRPAPSGAIVERHYQRYLVIAVVAGTEHWQISYRQQGSDVVASADVFDQREPGFPPQFIGPLRPDSPQTYQLLWDRVAYVLGQRPDWVTCDKYEDGLPRHSMDGGAEYGLCGEFSGERVPRR